MTIRKGEPWGTPGALPAGGVVVGSDAEARAVITEARRRGDPVPAIGLTGGDLCRTLGGPGERERLFGDHAITFPIDLGEVLIDGRLHVFVAHLIARNRGWTQAYVAMNAQWRRGWNLGPRAHPNDGLLDTYDAAVPVADLAKIHRRLPTGSHLPHPGIRERRTRAAQMEFARPRRVYLDGEHVGSARVLSVRVEPDALTVVV